jgi:hydrogenase-1 operon protein HyaE
MTTFSPLTRMLVERHRYTVATLDNVDALTADCDFAVLFFPGDAERLCESDDVAVVLPELMRAFHDRITPLVVSREAEMKLQARYRFNAFPALVFLRRGQYLGVIQRIQDWSDYLAEIGALLAAEPSAPPPFEFPDGCRTHGLQH